MSTDTIDTIDTIDQTASGATDHPLNPLSAEEIRAVRRIVDDLRPPALDELGLVGALQQRAEQLGWRADGAAVQVRLDVPTEVPMLPPAVEVATYRIATEAGLEVIMGVCIRTTRERVMGKG